MNNKNNHHTVEENYIALSRAVCNQAVDDGIRAIKHINRILKGYENMVKGSSSSDEESLKEVTKDLNKQMWRLNELQTFFEGEWFYALNGMGLTFQKVCRAITKNVIGREFDSLTDYMEYINNIHLKRFKCMLLKKV